MDRLDLAFASISQLGRLFRARKLSPVEVTKLMLERIERYNPNLNAYLTVSSALALSQARRAERELFSRSPRDRGPLHGIPISLKDNIYTKDVRTTAGSKILQDFVPLHDAPIVARLKQAGAVILGKNNMHEFAYGVTNNNPHYGPAHNPWNLDRITGGSSGGSAAAVAAGLSYASLGTDTGGSIRIPAALCGCVGFKPGIGRVNVHDVIPLSPTLDFVGPLARSVRDAALLLYPIFNRTRGERSLLPPRKLARRRFRLGVPDGFFLVDNALGARGEYERALKVARKEFATLHKFKIPMLEETEDAGNQIAWAEATQYHRQSGWFPKFADRYGEDVRTRLGAGEKVSAIAYLNALETRMKFIQALHAVMHDAKLDALIVPTTPIAAPLIGEEKTPMGGKEFSTRALLLRHNRPANLAGVPAISLPAGLTSHGLPFAMQLVGRIGGEPHLLEIASIAEHFLHIDRRPLLS